MPIPLSDTVMMISSLSPHIHSILAARIGKVEKAYQLFLHATRLDLDDKPTYQEAAELAHRLMDLYVAGEVDRVEIIYHHFKSMGVQILLRETYLPINLTNVVSEEDRENKEEVQENEIANDYIIEPNAACI